jgi:hypothetical protein
MNFYRFKAPGLSASCIGGGKWRWNKLRRRWWICEQKLKKERFTIFNLTTKNVKFLKQSLNKVATDLY